MFWWKNPTLSYFHHNLQYTWCYDEQISYLESSVVYKALGLLFRIWLNTKRRPKTDITRQLTRYIILVYYHEVYSDDNESWGKMTTSSTVLSLLSCLITKFAEWRPIASSQFLALSVEAKAATTPPWEKSKTEPRTTWSITLASTASVQIREATQTMAKVEYICSKIL